MRTEGDFIKINEWLLPLSWLYGLGVRLRNWMFNIGLKKSRSFDIPVISVGNITVGGSGKTPHVEYLINLLHEKFRVAVLSRGYKRKSSGYLLADEDTTMPEIGDEPFQMKSKYKDIYVAVDKNRCHGIDRLTTDEATKDVDAILLDDAYQHRYVKPGINILLIDYHRLIIYDKLLPAGRMREPKEGTSRADIVIITKCPKDLKPMEFRVLKRALNLYPYQELYFTTLRYNALKALFSNERISLNSLPKNTNILLLTGIASPEQMMVDLQTVTKRITPPPSATTISSPQKTWSASTARSPQCPSRRLSSPQRRTLHDLSTWKDSRKKQNQISMPYRFAYNSCSEGRKNSTIKL